MPRGTVFSQEYKGSLLCVTRFARSGADHVASSVGATKYFNVDVFGEAPLVDVALVCVIGRFRPAGLRFGRE